MSVLNLPQITPDKYIVFYCYHCEDNDCVEVAMNVSNLKPPCPLCGRKMKPDIFVSNVEITRYPAP